MSEDAQLVRSNTTKGTAIMGLYGYKLNGPSLLDKQSNHGKAVSKITTRKFDTAHYELTGELKYLDGGVTVATTLECENAKKMKLEIDSMEKFEAIGGTRAVARKWGVSKSTAHGLKTKLLAKEKNIMKSDESKATNNVTEEQEPTSEQHNTTTLDDCTIDDIECLKSCAESFDDDIKCDIIKGGDVEGETNRVPGCFGEFDPERYWCMDCKDSKECEVTFDKIKAEKVVDICESLLCHSCEEGKCIAENHSRKKMDDLNGIAEPEPEWSPELATPMTKEDLWEKAKFYLGCIHDELIAQAEQEFKEKLNQILGGMTV